MGLLANINDTYEKRVRPIPEDVARAVPRFPVRVTLAGCWRTARAAGRGVRNYQRRGSDLVYGDDEGGGGRAADQHVSTAPLPFLNLAWHAFSMGRSFSYNAVGEWMGQ